jgi:hypothetical protein
MKERESRLAKTGPAQPTGDQKLHQHPRDE